MTVFDLHSRVLTDYRDFVRSFITIADERIREFVDHSLDQEARLWPDPLIQVSPSYARPATVDDLAARGVLLGETARIFRNPDGAPFHLYQHQVEAIDLARSGQSYIVTSGTGSGKSLTYFLPIIDSLLRQSAAADRVSALVVYPMNALSIRDVARNPELDPQSRAAQEVWAAFTELTECRLYDDLRRGWRVVQPNLEHAGLLRVGYRGLEGLCRDDAHWRFHPSIAGLPAAEREILVHAVLDQFRRKLAISCLCLQETRQQQIRRRSEQHLNEFWGLDPDSMKRRKAVSACCTGSSKKPTWSPGSPGRLCSAVISTKRETISSRIVWRRATNACRASIIRLLRRLGA